MGALVPQVVDAVDANALVEDIDIDALISRVDVDGIIKRVDLDSLLQRIDLDALMERIDVDALIGRVDLDALVGKLDVNALVLRMDMDRLLDQVDVRALVKKAGIDDIIAETTTGMAARSLDLLRRQLLGLDTIILGFVDRVLRRGRTRDRVAADGSGDRLAGPVSRMLAFAADALMVSLIFTALVSLGGWLIDLFVSDHQPITSGGPVWAVAYFGWWWFYLTGSLVIAGRSPGKTLVGLRVRNVDGRPLGPWHSGIRTLTIPLSFILLIGLILGVVRRDRRALHDLFGRSQEVVDWGGREAALPSALATWIEHQQGHQAPRSGEDDLAAGSLLVELADGDDAVEVIDEVVPVHAEEVHRS
jgi:uncharacterized RDD family membrane protein YckC